MANKTTAVAVSRSVRRQDNSAYAGLDARIAVLEVMTADVGALVTNARLKQYRTYCQGDMEVIDDLQAFAPRTLISE